LSRKKRQREPFLVPAIRSEEWLARITEHAAFLREQHPELNEKSALVASVISLLTEGEMGLNHARIGRLTGQIMMLVDSDFRLTPEDPNLVTLKWARSIVNAYGYVRTQDWNPTNRRVSLMRALTHQEVPGPIPDDLRRLLVRTANELWPGKFASVYALEMLDTSPNTTKQMVIQLLDATISRLESPQRKESGNADG
jgi:hypothetical protein